MPASEEGLAFPAREQAVVEEEQPNKHDAAKDVEQTPTEEREDSQASTIAAGSVVDTPATSHPPSEADSTHPTTPSSAMPAQPARPAAASHTRTATIPAVPLIPIKPAKPASVASATQKSTKSAADKEERKEQGQKAEDALVPTADADSSTEETPKASPPPKALPKSWAELLRAKNAPAPTQTPVMSNGAVATNGPIAPKSNSLGDVLASFSVDSDKKIPFLEPRGLVNSGNLCYMNSVSESHLP